MSTIIVRYLSFVVCFLTVVNASSDKAWSPSPGLNKFSLLPRGLPTGTCNANTPCENAACCGTNGLCGYSPTECGKGNCTSNCDAKAQCGQFGTPGQQNCPLDVCCSQFGFCGSTDDFCGKGCQSSFGGCGPPNRPSCGTGSGSTSKRTIGYYESWSNIRKCQSVAPEDLNLNGFTHINFAFAFFDPSTFAIAPMDSQSGSLYNRFTALKNSNPGLQTWISVGGWSFTDPGPTREAFSNMASNSGNRQAFINNVMHFMDSYGFDGVDLDWEYPQADDRGGQADDTKNYVSLVKEMRAAFGSKFGISMTLPTSYWYLQHFDLKGIQDSVDWFNLMAYDLHGVWDAESQFVGPFIAPHTNITEIDLGLDLLWRAGVEPSKVVMGQGWYGRSFTLKNPSCNTPNGVCQFTGGANPGPCSNAAGILDDQEIQDIIKQNNLNPTFEKTAAVKWITWDSNQWVSYDDADTFSLKRDFANNRCLGGLMVWAMDQVDQKADNNLAPAPGVTTSQQQDARQMSENLNAGVTCRTTGCNQQCPKGTNQVAQVAGNPGQLSTADQCVKGQYHDVCCDDGTFMGVCTWRGYRGAGLSCVKGCEDGETEVLTDTSFHNSKGDFTCTGGLQSYCCRGFKPAPSKQNLENDATDAAKSLAEQAAEQAALDIAAKAFCRIAVPALLAPLELLEDLIPIVGEILDIAEIAATPELIQLCVKGVEKEGKAEFKVFGKTRTIDGFTKPTEKPPETRPPESSHSSAKTSDDSCGIAAAKGKRAPGARCIQKITTTSIVSENAAHTETFVCKYAEHSQACLHYSSAVDNNAGLKFVTCPYKKPDSTARPAVAQYNRERVAGAAGWLGLIPNLNGIRGGGCERDEWPPALFLESNNGRKNLEGGQEDPDRTQYIRLDPAADNVGAGQLWAGKCPVIAKNSRDHGVVSIDDRGPGRATRYTQYQATYTRQVFEIEFDMTGFNSDGDDGLSINPCRPVIQGSNNDYRGYAMLFADPYFDKPAKQQFDFRNEWRSPPPSKRDLNGLHPDMIGVVDRNSTRQATDEELWRDFGIARCEDETCHKELEALGQDSVRVINGREQQEPSPPEPQPITEVAAATAFAVPDAGISPKRSKLSADLPERTEVPGA